MSDTHDFEDTQLQEKSAINLSVCSETMVLVQEMVNLVQKASLDMPKDAIQIGRQIGEGQFCLVSKGTCNGVTCAVKRMRGGLARTITQYKRFLIELSILASLKAHPNIVCIVGACIEDLNAPLILQEYVDGQNLEEHLSAMKPGFNLGQAKVGCHIRITTPHHSS
jgi:serine/threonine protein kinase